MTGRRRFYLAVVGWLSIVAVGSTLVWTVVAQAGRDVGEPGRDTLAASSATEPSGSAEPSASATASESAGQTATEPATGSATESATETATESATESAGPPAGSPSASSDPEGDGDPTASNPPPPETHRRTWQGTAGRVVASCTGAKISLVAAQPHNGWRVEVDDRGPQELSVKFELTEEEEDDRVFARSVAGEVFDEVEVHAHCAGGVPSFSVDG